MPILNLKQIIRLSKTVKSISDGYISIYHRKKYISTKKSKLQAKKVAQLDEKLLKISSHGDFTQFLF